MTRVIRARVTVGAGELHLAAGRTREALATLTLAYEAWDDMDHDLGKARTLRDMGAARTRAGDCPGAHDAWDVALAVFSRLGTCEATELPDWHRRWGCGAAVDAPRPRETDTGFVEIRLRPCT